VTDPDLAALLPPIEAVDALPAEALPGVIAHLAALQARAAAGGWERRRERGQAIG